MPRQIPEYLTFDDVLMKPGASSVLPAQVKTGTRLTIDHRHFMSGTIEIPRTGDTDHAGAENKHPQTATPRVPG